MYITIIYSEFKPRPPRRACGTSRTGSKVIDFHKPKEVAIFATLVIRRKDHMGEPDTPKKKRKSGIPTGNAGEYFVMGELLRRGFDAQLADRNTKGYDLLVGRPTDTQLRKVQVKSVRAQPWYVSQRSFVGEAADQVTIYVLIGPETAQKPIRYFIVKNKLVAAHVHTPTKWRDNALLGLKALAPYENDWKAVLE